VFALAASFGLTPFARYRFAAISKTLRSQAGYLWPWPAAWHADQNLSGMSSGLGWRLTPFGMLRAIFDFIPKGCCMRIYETLSVNHPFQDYARARRSEPDSLVALCEQPSKLNSIQDESVGGADTGRDRFRSLSGQIADFSVEPPI
jgi:hypothetical protein